MTNRLKIASIIQAACILLKNSDDTPLDAKLAEAVIHQAGQFMQRLWLESYATMTRREQVTNFWRVTGNRIAKHKEVVTFTVLWSDSKPLIGRMITIEFAPCPDMTPYKITLIAPE